MLPRGQREKKKKSTFNNHDISSYITSNSPLILLKTLYDSNKKNHEGSNPHL